MPTNCYISLAFIILVCYPTDKTNVIKFTINDDETNQIIVNENNTVNMSCEIEGDPLPKGQLLHQMKSSIKNQLLRTISTSQHSTILRLSSVFHALCSDTGVHTCMGSNTFHSGRQSTSNKNIFLFVNCSPRQYPSFELKQHITSALNATVTFHFTTMAYPTPVVQWYRILNGVETSKALGGVVENIYISPNVMQTKYTLDYVNESHFGEYLLNITNQYGSFQQRFYLIAEATEASSETLTKPGIVGAAVGGAFGGLLVIVAIVVVGIIVRKRVIGETTGPNNESSDVNDLHAYQNFQHVGQSSLDGPSSPIYEKLQHTDSEPDQQYQQLAAFSEKDKTDGPNKRVYENLQLSHQKKENNVNESSE